jgi:hypothetical protein
VTLASIEIHGLIASKGTAGRKARRMLLSWTALWRSGPIYSMVWVRERTIPIERPPLVGEVIANFCGWRVPRGQCDGSLRPHFRFSRQEPLFFYQVAPQLYSRGWVDPVPDPLLLFLVSPGIEPGPPDLQPRTR